MNQKDKPLISILLPTHHEGRILHPTIKSICRAIDFAKGQGITAEIVIIGDALDEPTRKFIKQIIVKFNNYSINFDEVNFRDLGLTRNAAVKKARGTYVATIDGDDLMSENWLVKASKQLKNYKGELVVHPEYVFFFEARHLLWPVPTSEGEKFSRFGSIETNYFCVMMMTKKSILEKIPYKGNPEGFGFEDWHWNVNTVNAGIPHQTVSETMFAYRVKKRGSLFATWNDSLLSPTDYLLPHGKNDKILNSKPPLLPAGQKEESLKRDKLLSASQKFTRKSFRIARPISKLHPRLDSYMTSLQNETQHLFRPVEKLEAKLPNWMVDEIKQLHLIDHRIFATLDLQTHIEVYDPQPTAFSEAYWQLIGRIYQQCEYLFVVPYLKNGGAEKVLAGYIQTILTNSPNAKITVLSTQPEPSPFASKLDKRVNFVEPGEAFFKLNEEQQPRLLANLIMQAQPDRVHIVNSSVVGYRALERYAKPLSRFSKLYVTIFAIDRTTDGWQVHLFIDNMQNAINYVDKVFTDNQYIVDHLVDLMAIERSKFQVVYQPTNFHNNTSEIIPHKLSRLPYKILWAGRIDIEKRPEVFTSIAATATSLKLPVEFHVYGTSALGNSNLLETIKNSPHINYRGGFEGGLKSLPLDDYDMYILTSQWEGLPNTLLEAAEQGLLLISANVGGVSEIIEDGKTGLLVNEFNNVDEYIKKIKLAIEHPETSRKMIKASQAYIKKKFSDANYNQAIKNVKGYLD